jgi:TRAP-type C4-dicarboxylate transport system permease small subunit
MAVLFFAAVGFVENELAMFGPKGWAAVILPVFFALAAFRFLIQFLDQLVGTPDRHPPSVSPPGGPGQTEVPRS